MKVDRIKTIRLLVLIALISYLIWVFDRVLFWGLLSDDSRRLAILDGYGAVVHQPKHMYLGWVFLSVMSYMGIYFFRKWGGVLLRGRSEFCVSLSG